MPAVALFEEVKKPCRGWAGRVRKGCPALKRARSLAKLLMAAGDLMMAIRRRYAVAMHRQTRTGTSIDHSRDVGKRYCCVEGMMIEFLR